jgi:hypothetical protein
MIHIGHVDLNVVEHCNNRCVSCSHASPVLNPWSMPPEMVEHDLLRLRTVLHAGCLHLVGGEPLLHKGLTDIIKLVKRIRLADSTLVITNGKLLPRMDEDFWRELESLSISIYPDLSPDIVKLAEEKSRQFGFNLYTTVFERFYIQLKKQPDDGVESFKNCHWKTDCYTVHRGHFYLCSQSCFFPKSVMGMPDAVDGLSLDDITDQKLKDYMLRTEPFNACKVCCANEMEVRPWAETNRGQWIKESTQ